SQLARELAARGRPDGLDHLAAGADEDALLGLRLDPDERADDREVDADVLDVLDDHLDGVRDLLERPPQHLLADELGQMHLEWLVPRVLIREEEMALAEERTRER